MITQTLNWRIAAILLLALGLRLWGTSFGLPYDLTPDEPHQILQALKIGAGEGGPLVQMWHTVGKGGLDYLLFLEYGVLFCFWWLTGAVSSANDFALRYLQDPSAFYLIGRGTVALLGALTCVAAYAAGRHMYSERVALLAALIGALALNHATDSHLINVHVPMAFALWAAVWAYTCWEARPGLRRLVATGVLAGLAVSLAYNAAVGVLMLAAAMLTRNDPRLSGKERALPVLQLLGVTCATLLVFAPELLLRGGALLHNFQQLLGTPRPSAPGAEVRAAIDEVTILREQGWLDYLPILFGPRNLAISIAALVGIAAGLIRRERWTWLLSMTTLLLVLLLSASDRGTGERYLMPMLPALWLLAARGVVAAAAGRAWLQAGFALLIVVPAMVQIVRADYTLSQTDSRVIAKQWIEANVPPDARMLVDGMRFRFMQSPPLKPNVAALERQIAALKASELRYPERFLALYREAKLGLPGPGYDLYSTMYGLEVDDPDYYVSQCFDYVIVSSGVTRRYEAGPLRERHPQTVNFYEGIRTHPAYHEVYQITGEHWTRPGPTIIVYKIDSRCADPTRTTSDQ